MSNLLIPAVLSIGITADDAELRDRVVGNNANLLADRLLPTGAVQEKLISRLALPIDGELACILISGHSNGVEAAARSAMGSANRRNGRNPCLGRQRIRIATSIQRYLSDLSAGNGLAPISARNIWIYGKRILSLIVGGSSLFGSVADIGENNGRTRGGRRRWNR
jgi:hypothetical protein